MNMSAKPEEDSILADDKIVGSLRAEIRQAGYVAASAVPRTPEEYEWELDQLRQESKTVLEKQQREIKVVEWKKADEPQAENYSRFFTAKPRHWWQWPLLLTVRLALRVKAWAQKIDRSGELFGALALVLLIGGCVAGLCVM